LPSWTEAERKNAKLARAAKDGVAAWVHPEGYRKYVAAARSKFEATAENEKAMPDGD
jgi:hypothetical protein